MFSTKRNIEMDFQGTNDFDMLRGKKINDMERLFQKRLDDIEKKYTEYFSERPPLRKLDEHDRLYNHYFCHQYDKYSKLIWLESSDLNETIKEEVEKAFREIFVS
jgi:hypothetical protein